ncbi:DMT family transporter [Rhizobium sp. PAMB 3174]
MSRVQANIVLLIAAAVWGGGFVAQATAMETLGAMWFIGLRFAIAALATVPFVIHEARKAKAPAGPKAIRAFILIGLALFGGAATQQFGLLTTSVTNSGFLTGLYVIIVPVLFVVFLRRKPHWIIWPAAVMAVSGIYLLSGGDLGALNSGDILTIICGVFWAIQVTLIGLFLEKYPRPLLLSCIQFTVCAVLGLAIAFVTEPIDLKGLTEALPEVIYSGLFSSGLAFVLQVIGQRYTTAPQAAIFLSSESLFAAAAGAIFLGEKLTAIGYFGCAIIFAAMLIVEIVPELTRRRTAPA